MIRTVFAAAVLMTSGAALAQDRELSADQAKALEIYKTVIGIRTAKGYGNVPKMAAYLSGELKGAGFKDEDIEIVPVGETAGMIVHYRGDGSSGKKPILFLAHMDVVDANPDDWEFDPFTLREENGFFVGRGTVDNKYGVTNLTQTFMRLKKEGFVPTRDLYLAFSGDEETGMDTTKLLANDREDLAQAEFALNSDAGGITVTPEGDALPYYMQAAEKTYATFTVTARNPGGHSSVPRPDNAIYDLADALEKIRAYKFPVMSNGVTIASMKASADQVGGDMGKALADFAENPKNKKAIKTIRSEPEFSHFISTTCVATMLEAGHAENALPQSATATVNCRIFPGVEIEDVRQTLAEVAGNEALEITPLEDDYVASPASDPREDVTSAIQAALSDRYPGIAIVPAMSSGGTDGLHFRNAGIPTFGAGGWYSILGESENAHGLNEHLRVDAFYSGLDHWIAIIKELAGPAQE